MADYNRAGTHIAPILPKEFRGKSGRGGVLSANPKFRAWIKTRNAFARKCLADDVPLVEIVAALNRGGHPIRLSGLKESLNTDGGVPVRKRGYAPKAGKGKREEVSAVASLLDELVAKRIGPLQAEIARLQPFEKKWLALKAFMEKA